MKRMMSALLVAAIGMLIAHGAVAMPQYVKSVPLAQVIKTPVGNVENNACTPLFIITWGADVNAIAANGNSVKTAKGSVFDNEKIGKEGLCFELVRQDNYRKQFEAYIAGKTPYLRMPLDALMLGLEVLNRDLRTVPQVIEVRSRSTGGDVFVVKDSIRQPSDLKGKVIVLQDNGLHFGFLARVLKDAGLTMQDVKIRLVEDLVGVQGNTPGAALREDSTVDAAFVISPDAALLTTPPKVKTPESFFVPGAHVLLSTKTLDHIIFDVYAVRSDHIQASKAKAEKFVHGLFMSEEQVSELFKNTSLPGYAPLIKASAEILYDSPKATDDVEGLYGDGKTLGYGANVSFFTDPKNLRGFEVMVKEIQEALMSIGMMGKKIPLAHAHWDYSRLKDGLQHAGNVVAPNFDNKVLTQLVNKKQQQGSSNEGNLFMVPVFFGIEEAKFDVNRYAPELLDVIERAAVYGGAGVDIIAYADPTNYLEQKANGATPEMLRRIRQAAKGLSAARAMSMKKAVLDLAENRGVLIDPSQFVITGLGIDRPVDGMCGQDPCMPKDDLSKEKNRRVEFRFLQVEAESTASGK